MKPLLLKIALLHQLTHALPPPRIPDILERINLQKQQQQEEGLLDLSSTTQQKQTDGASKKSKEDDTTNDDVTTLYFDQHLNHFPDTNDSSGNPTKTTTFKQRYFYSSRYVKSSKKDDTTNKNKKKSVAFLCVGGEGPSMDTSVLINSVHCTGDMIGLAEKLYKEDNYDVHLFALGKFFYVFFLVLDGLVCTYKCV